MNEEDLVAVLEAIERGEIGNPPAVLAWVAGQKVELPPRELNEGRRRALLLLAAGGDPHRELDVDDRAVKALAVDLYSEERRAALSRGIDELVPLARELPEVRRALVFLAGDADLAWRLYVLGLLAEELADG